MDTLRGKIRILYDVIIEGIRQLHNGTQVGIYRMVYLSQHRLVFLLDGRRHLPYQTPVERNPHQDQGRQRTDGEIQIDGRADADTAEKFRQFFLCHSASSSAILGAAVFRR